MSVAALNPDLITAPPPRSGRRTSSRRGEQPRSASTAWLRPGPSPAEGGSRASTARSSLTGSRSERQRARLSRRGPEVCAVLCDEPGGGAHRHRRCHVRGGATGTEGEAEHSEWGGGRLDGEVVAFDATRLAPPSASAAGGVVHVHNVHPSAPPPRQHRTPGTRPTVTSPVRDANGKSSGPPRNRRIIMSWPGPGRDEPTVRWWGGPRRPSASAQGDPPAARRSHSRPCRNVIVDQDRWHYTSIRHA